MATDTPRPTALAVEIETPVVPQCCSCAKTDDVAHVNIDHADGRVWMPLCRACRRHLALDLLEATADARDRILALVICPPNSAGWTPEQSRAAVAEARRFPPTEDHHSPRVHGAVIAAAGGHIDVVVDRGTVAYPAVGTMVTLTPRQIHG